MRSNRFAWSAALLVGGIVTNGVRSAAADLLVYEPFAYADGWLNGQGGALGTTGTWTAYDTKSNDWRIHQEGDTSGIVVDPGPPIERNMFDGTVANLMTAGGYVGLPGPLDLDPPADPDEDFEIGRYMDASIGLDPSVTATFQSGTTTWFSYVAVAGWDRNRETPNFTIGTDPSPNESRAASLSNEGNGFGTGGGPPRNNRTAIYPMSFDGGIPHNFNGAITAWTQDDDEVPADSRMEWVASDADGFGAVNIIVGKIEWDADTGGEDFFSVVRFLEGETISEAAFDALILAQPNLSSANWDSNATKLDQAEFDTLNFAGTKYFVDEIRIGTSFADVTPSADVGPAGDVNLDGVVNGLDVDPFVNLVTSGTYQEEGDMNGDGVVNGLDVDPFVEAVVGGGVAAVPEPSTLLLCLVALGVVAGRRKWGE